MKKKFSVLLVLLWMLLIFFLSSLDSNESSKQSGLIVNILSNILHINNIEALSIIIRKIAHLSEYFILGLLVYNMISKYKKRTYIAVIICILYAISDEFHQSFIPGRSCQTLDIAIDIIGSNLGILLLFLKNKHKF